MARNEDDRLTGYLQNQWDEEEWEWKYTVFNLE